MQVTATRMSLFAVMHLRSKGTSMPRVSVSSTTLRIVLVGERCSGKCPASGALRFVPAHLGGTGGLHLANFYCPKSSIKRTGFEQPSLAIGPPIDFTAEPSQIVRVEITPRRGQFDHCRKLPRHHDHTWDVAARISLRLRARSVKFVGRRPHVRVGPRSTLPCPSTRQSRQPLHAGNAAFNKASRWCSRSLSS